MMLSSRLTFCYQVTCQEPSSWIPQALILIILNSENFYCRKMEFWLRIALIQLAHLPKGASTQPRVPYCSPQQNGLATLVALLLVAVRDPLLTTSSPLPGPLLTRLSLRFHHLPVLSKWPATPGEVTQHLAMHFSWLSRIYQVLSF